MNEPSGDLARDLRTLQYIDALEAGDLEAVAALWNDAGNDPQLAQILREVDQALFTEHAAELREDGCLPAQAEPTLGRRPWTARKRWTGVVGIAVAASLLILLARAKSLNGKPGPTPRPNELALPVAPKSPDHPVRIAARRDHPPGDADALPAFTWPLEGNAPELSISLHSARLRDRDRSL